MTEPDRTDVDRVWGLLQGARAACRRLTSVLIANAHRLDTPFSNDPRTPWQTHVSPAVNGLRVALGMRGAWPTSCSCDLHGRTCEPPSELCCENCSEIHHPAHVDGSICSAPDLGGTGMPTAVEMALRTEVIRLMDERPAALAAAEERGRRKAIADLRDTAAFHNWQADHGRYEGDRTELIDYLESLDRSGT